MEKKIGMFGQNRYVLKGLIKPRFFNRLAEQGNSKIAGYVILMAVISAILFWGIKVLVINSPNGLVNQTEKEVRNLPVFTYEEYMLSMEGDYEKSNIDRDRFVVVDTSVERPDAEYLRNMCIRIDWSIGKIALVFNSKSMTLILPIGNGKGPTFEYTSLQKILGYASKLNNSTIAAESVVIIYKAVGVLALASILVFAVTNIISGLIASAVGFLIVKILKLQYSYKELVRIGMYVAGVTTLIKVVLNAQPIPVPFIAINVIFVLATAAYMFFALTGSQEEAGPSSTIVFSKPTSKKFSGEIEPMDPFARKDRFRNRTEDTSKSTSSDGVRAVSAPIFTRKSEYVEPARVEPAPVYEKPQPAYVEPAPVYEEPQPAYVEQTPVYEEPQTAYVEPAPIYEETQPVYAEQAPVYEEPQVSYAEQTPVYVQEEVPSAIIKEEPVAQTVSSIVKEESPRPMIIKSEATFGVGYGTGTAKKTKPKYDRPITAPDSYNGAYYGGSDEEGYSNTYGASTLLDRGGLYGKTLGSPSGSVDSNPFGNVIAASAERNTPGGSTLPKSENEGGVVFTTKTGSQPFIGGGVAPTYKPGKTVNSGKTNVSSKPYTKAGSTKPISRYTADDFAAWERENFAEEFSKPRGGFGNNI